MHTRDFFSATQILCFLPLVSIFSLVCGSFFYFPNLRYIKHANQIKDQTVNNVNVKQGIKTLKTLHAMYTDRNETCFNKKIDKKAKMLRSHSILFVIFDTEPLYNHCHNSRDGNSFHFLQIYTPLTNSIERAPLSSCFQPLRRLGENPGPTALSLKFACSNLKLWAETNTANHVDFRGSQLPQNVLLLRKVCHLRHQWLLSWWGQGASLHWDSGNEEEKKREEKKYQEKQPSVKQCNPGGNKKGVWEWCG